MLFLVGLLFSAASAATHERLESALRTTSAPQTLFSTSNVTKEQQLCEMVVDRYNMFVDMVPIFLTISFPTKNEYFTGDAEVFFFPVQKVDKESPNCTMFTDKDVKLLRIDVLLKLEILNEGRRVEIEKCRLGTHLRLESEGERLQLQPQLVDVQILGDVLEDTEVINRTRAQEVLRPVLLKAFTHLAEKDLAFSGFRSGAVFVDPALGRGLLKQLFLSYLTQL